MHDRETVITHLQIISTWASFAREFDLQFFTAKHLEDIAQWTKDTLELLKEHEAVVRCKDCKKRFTEECGLRLTCMPREDMFYCAAGRKQDGRD